jgi:hypothetical protein
MNQTNATHRDGQRGHLGALDQNGFALFESTTGARFTVHSTECEMLCDGVPLNLWAKVRAGWPSGCLWFKFDERGGALSIIRTPTAAQCNAKRSAANAARLADAERRVQS